MPERRTGNVREWFSSQLVSLLIWDVSKSGPNHCFKDWLIIHTNQNSFYRREGVQLSNRLAVVLLSWDVGELSSSLTESGWGKFWEWPVTSQVNANKMSVGIHADHSGKCQILLSLVGVLSHQNQTKPKKQNTKEKTKRPKINKTKTTLASFSNMKTLTWHLKIGCTPRKHSDFFYSSVWGERARTFSECN